MFSSSVAPAQASSASRSDYDDDDDDDDDDDNAGGNAAGGQHSYAAPSIARANATARRGFLFIKTPKVLLYDDTRSL